MLNINSTKLISNIGKSIKKTLNEYYDSGHTFDDVLNNYEFFLYVDRVIQKYDAKEFLKNDDMDKIKDYIVDLFDDDFITDKELNINRWGYNGPINLRKIASNIIKYIKSHIDVLY